MKSIIISIKPEWVAKILNEEKTIEIRKTKPKCELPVEVYIYCTKGKPFIGSHSENGKRIFTNHIFGYVPYYNGKVVAKFTLNKVGEYIKPSMKFNPNSFHKNKVYEQNTFWQRFRYKTNLEGLLEKSCLTNEELEKYIGIEENKFYAWNIDDLQIFDEPKKLDDFYKKCDSFLDCIKCKRKDKNSIGSCDKRINKAPQSWCYCEVK